MRYILVLLAAFVSGCSTYQERHPELYTYKGDEMVNHYTLKGETVKWVRANINARDQVICALWLPKNRLPGEDVFLCSMACDRFSPGEFAELVGRVLKQKMIVIELTLLEKSLDTVQPLAKGASQ